MKQILVAGNWKSNKTRAEAEEWLRQFNAKCPMPNAKWKDSTIVLCVPFTLLHFLHDQIKKFNLPIVLGAQDMSPYPDGAYTGAVNARQIKEFADWVIIGHSERRKYFGETDEILGQKVRQAKTAGLKIIYCVPDDHTPVPADIDVAAYEPVWAIGTGKADTPENANAVIASLKQKFSIRTVLYGGSVMPDNVASFVAQPAIDGVLPGGASLDAEKFIGIVGACREP